MFSGAKLHDVAVRAVSPFHLAGALRRALWIACWCTWNPGWSGSGCNLRCTTTVDGRYFAFGLCQQAPPTAHAAERATERLSFPPRQSFVRSTHRCTDEAPHSRHYCHSLTLPLVLARATRHSLSHSLAAIFQTTTPSRRRSTLPPPTDRLHPLPDRIRSFQTLATAHQPVATSLPPAQHHHPAIHQSTNLFDQSPANRPPVHSSLVAAAQSARLPACNSALQQSSQNSTHTRRKPPPVPALFTRQFCSSSARSPPRPQPQAKRSKLHQA